MPTVSKGVKTVPKSVPGASAGAKAIPRSAPKPNSSELRIPRDRGLHIEDPDLFDFGFTPPRPPKRSPSNAVDDLLALGTGGAAGTGLHYLATSNQGQNSNSSPNMLTVQGANTPYGHSLLPAPQGENNYYDVQQLGQPANTSQMSTPTAGPKVMQPAINPQAMQQQYGQSMYPPGLMHPGG